MTAWEFDAFWLLENHFSSPRAGHLRLIQERINEYGEKVGMNYLIDRGRIPGTSLDEQVRSFEMLLRLTHN